MNDTSTLQYTCPDTVLVERNYFVVPNSACCNTLYILTISSPTSKIPYFVQGGQRLSLISFPAFQKAVPPGLEPPWNHSHLSNDSQLENLTLWPA